MHELYKKYRPKNLDELIGQPEAVQVLKRKIKKKSIPHAIILTGPSGCGKTSVARILANKLQCDETCFVEINASDSKGIDTIRTIKREMSFYGLGKNRVRVYLLDEVHKMTSDAQNAMLKSIEDTPPHVYFILATTDPAKVIKTVHSRCTEIRLNELAPADLRKIVTNVARKEGIRLKDKVIKRLIEASEGGARKALVILEMLEGVSSVKEQLKIINTNDSKAPAINIARKLLDGRTRWNEMAKVLKDNMDEDPEGMRHMVLGYCTSILLSGQDNARAASIIDFFRDSFFESKKAGLVLACWEVIHAK